MDLQNSVVISTGPGHSQFPFKNIHWLTPVGDCMHVWNDSEFNEIAMTL